MLRLSKRSFSILVAVVLSNIILFTYINFYKTPAIPLNYRSYISEIGDPNSNSYWGMCKLPEIDIWDEEMFPHIDPDFNPYANCNPIKEYTLLIPPYIVINRHLDPEDLKGLKCMARCHHFLSEFSNAVSDWFDVPHAMRCDVVEAVCSKNGNLIWGYLHSQVVPQPSLPLTVEKRMEFDVFVFLIDSMAYSQAKRSLPRTLSYFKNHLRAVEFPYINKVGENSRPNGIAMWFGLTAVTIDRSMFNDKVYPPDINDITFCKEYLDEYNSIFKEFRNYGYKTMLSEDWALGTMNYPNCVGFRQPPTDHYMRPFQLALGKFGATITRKHINPQSCREDYHTLLDYQQQFMDAYKNKRKFSWIWVSTLGHDYENGIVRSDKEFHRFFIKNRKMLDNAFVLLMGDHGLRLDEKVRKTKLGALEVNNPYLGISIPKALRKSTKLLKNLRTNSRSLQTHYDTRATLLDILKYQPEEKFRGYKHFDIKNEKGTSMLRMQPNFTRTCSTLPIPYEYCICEYATTELDHTTGLAMQMGKIVVDKVNENVNQNRKICEVMLFKNTIFLEKFQKMELYRIIVQVDAPILGKFKALIRVSSDGTMSVQGNIERMDLYRDTAKCMKVEHLRPFCYCKGNK